jgi:hypothetical protein
VDESKARRSQELAEWLREAGVVAEDATTLALCRMTVAALDFMLGVLDALPVGSWLAGLRDGAVVLLVCIGRRCTPRAAYYWWAAYRARWWRS